jgi:hypothetical protein
VHGVYPRRPRGVHGTLTTIAANLLTVTVECEFPALDQKFYFDTDSREPRARRLVNLQSDCLDDWHPVRNVNEQGTPKLLRA